MMTTFIQLHLLTAYPAANLNRDDTGAPKTVMMGGSERLRVSSQSLKRAWRTSDLFEEAMAGHIGKRTARIGREAAKIMIARGVNEKKAAEWGTKIANYFGKAKSAKEKELKEDPLLNTDTEQLVHISPFEWQRVEQLAERLGEEKREPTADELSLLTAQRMAVDISLFGRMLASSPEFNVEAVCQVAHAVGVSTTVVEDDFFTAVDDLRQDNGETGAGHMGEQGFGAALFYNYLCIDRDQLLKNLNNDEELTQRALRALTECALKVSPTGKQNSFASRAYASWALAEKGTEQPRTLAAAFYKPVYGDDHITQAISRITALRKNMDAVYQCRGNQVAELNALTGEGTLENFLGFVSA